MLATGLIGLFYTRTLHGQRNRDRVHVVYSRSEERATSFWANHFLRTGFEMFTSGSGDGYVAEKSESASGWLFPVGDEVSELGYTDMFTDTFDAIDEGRAARETFYDGYVVDAIIDACCRSAETRQWGNSAARTTGAAQTCRESSGRGASTTARR